MVKTNSIKMAEASLQRVAFLSFERGPEEQRMPKPIVCSLYYNCQRESLPDMGRTFRFVNRWENAYL